MNYTTFVMRNIQQLKKRKRKNICYLKTLCFKEKYVCFDFIYLMAYKLFMAYLISKFD